eukprot:m51a1_g5566 putative signal recognition particle 14 kda protein (121) ;mRNA; f:596226-596839
MLLDNDAFLSELTKMLVAEKDAGHSVWITCKRYTPFTPKAPKEATAPADAAAPKPKAKKTKPDDAEPKCMFRVTNGKKKFSTLVRARESARFQLSYMTVLRAHMDGLKKRERKAATADKA